MGTVAVRRGFAFGLAAGGAVLLGATGVVVQAYRSDVAGRSVPWGLALTLLAVLVAVRGACWWLRSRVAGVVVGAVWMLTTLVMSQSGPGGDVLLPDDLRSQVYLLGGLALAVAAVLVPLPWPDALPPPGALPAQDGLSAPQDRAAPGR